MTATFTLNADELDESFIEGLKKTFAHRRIEIAVHEAGDDATAYLMSSDENNRRLMEAIEDAKAGRNLVTPDQSVFQ
jgi:antitoxin YefM